MQDTRLTSLNVSILQVECGRVHLVPYCMDAIAGNLALDQAAKAFCVCCNARPNCDSIALRNSEPVLKSHFHQCRLALIPRILLQCRLPSRF